MNLIPKKNRIASIVAALLLMAIPSLAQAAPTTVFDGENESVKPEAISGLNSGVAESGYPVYVSGRSGNLKAGVGPIEWDIWKRSKAVGKGRGRAVGCPPTCPADYPWNGTKIRVTAYGRRGGTFTRLKVFQWTQWMEVDGAFYNNYTMKLRLKGGEWTVTEIDDGKP